LTPLLQSACAAHPVVVPTDAPGYRHAAGLAKFLAEHPQAVGGILLHGGQQIRRLDERIVAVPWSLLTG
jgi:hypothetical protein